MERMSDEQLEQQIQRFMKRKMDQFPSLAEHPGIPRQDSVAWRSRIGTMSHRVVRLHSPRHVSLT